MLQRNLKIQKKGDPWKTTYPEIKLSGQWLKDAGIPEEGRVIIKIDSPGKITIELEKDKESGG